MEKIRATALATGRAIVPLLEDERVALRWSEPSALAMLSVGGLAGHLARALDTVSPAVSPARSAHPPAQEAP